MLPRQLKEIRFDTGLNTKGDKRAQPEQLLDIAVNVEFDDIGGLRCRFPFDNVRTALVGGGALANARKLALYGDELLCFTDSALYSWIPSKSAWLYRGDHLAIHVAEQTRFATTDDQRNADRAELNGVVVYAWDNGTNIYVAAMDKISGATITAPTVIIGGVQPRLVACQTKILLFYATPFGLLVTNIDPANVTANLGTATGIGTITGYYDVVRIPNADGALGVGGLSPTTSYMAFTCTAALSVTTATKARTAVGAVGVSCTPDGVHAQIVRIDGAVNTLGDLLTISTLADVHTGQSIIAGSALPNVSGITTPQIQTIAVAHRAVQNSGHYRAYVSVGVVAANHPSVAVATCANWVDDGNNIGGSVTTQFQLQPASRAFAYNQNTFVWVTFAESSTQATPSALFASALQNTYFLYRDDGFLAAKAVVASGAGYSASTTLPGVTLTDGSTTFSWCGGIRRIVPIGAVGSMTYAERAPREIIFTFDDNTARRSLLFGNTLYIPCGEGVLTYDGHQIAEAGFHVYPWYLNVTDVGSGGSMPTGTTWSWKNTFSWLNAAGELDRSTSATVQEATSGSGSDSFSMLTDSLTPTHKSGVTIEFWRTAGNPPAGAPFFLVSSLDPTNATNPNRYIPNIPATGSVEGVVATFVDAEADATATEGQVNPENDGALANVSPPPCSIIAADATRIYLAGVAGSPNTVWYSQYRQDGFVAAFNDALTFETPVDGGAITAIGVLEGTLIVWCETATYAFAGPGFDNTGQGTNFALSRILSRDLGCVSQEALAYYEDGWLLKTSKGWYLLDRSLNYTYFGAGPKKYDDEAVLGMTVLTARHQVRILTSGRMLVFDTLVKQWAESSINDGLDVLLWEGAPTYLTATGARAELATWDGYAGTDYTLTAMDIESSWIKFGETMQSRAIVDFVQLLGEFRSTCVVRARIAKDYEATSPGNWNYNTDVTWTPSPAIVGSSLQLRQGPRWKRVEALKTRFTVTAPGGMAPLGGPCARLTAIAIPHAIEPNAYSAIAAAQKQ